MSMSHGLRQYAKASARYARKRRDSEEDNIYLDLSRDATELIQDILVNVISKDVNVNRKLGYLNGLVKLCVKQSDLGASYREVFCCLRMCFFHEACEVRAAGIRACRYILQHENAFEAFMVTKLQFFVARSLDISLDNRVERIQALRLMRKVLGLYPDEFPSAFSKCLVAIANEGSPERDMLRPCLATLSQLALLNSQACIEANGIHAIMKNIVEISHIQATESMLGVIFYLINHPTTRSFILQDFCLESLLAPFTDVHYRFPTCVDGSASEDKDPNLSSSRAAIISTLHSWPGLIYLCQTDCNHLQSLVEMLYLPYPDLRKCILDLLYQLFDIPVPEWTDDFSEALCAIDPAKFKTTWQLYEGYIVAEGTDILPYTSKDRMNLVHDYCALLLFVFVNCGVLEAISKVIVLAEIHLSIRATIFLGEFIYMANQFLPVNCSHLSNCLPTLISNAAATESVQKQNQATAALTCLSRIHELKKKGSSPNSLVLHNILHVCNPEREKKGLVSGMVSKIKMWKYLKQEMTESIEQAIKDTQVLIKDHHSWDWDLVDCILKNPSDHLKKLEDANHKMFLKKLVHFFKPSSNEFSELELDKETGRQICITGCHLLELFLEIEEFKAQEYLDDFFNDLNACLLQLTKDGERLNSVLSPIKVTNSYSQMYFLFIGKMSSTHKGCKYLNRCNTFQNLLHLLNITNQVLYIKLIVSTLDYSKDGFSRTILTKALTATEEAGRLYATNFLLILLRAKLPDFRKWAIEVLVFQLHDTSRMVSSAALEILDEACNIKENLEALISLRPSLLQLGDKGLLLLVRYLSTISGFTFLKESNFLHCELERWHKVYNLKYVKIVEDALNETFTHHRRNSEGLYGKRSSEMSYSIPSLYLPPHIYGQLVHHEESLKILEKETVLHELYNNIREPKFSTDIEVLHLKASLWAVGHIGSYPLGLSVVLKENLIQNIVELVCNSPVFSIRGTCYFILGLLSSTPEGVAAIADFGWESVQRNREEKWPLVKEELVFDPLEGARKSTWSFSSTGSEWNLGAIPNSLSFIMKGDTQHGQSFKESDAEKDSHNNSFSSEHEFKDCESSFEEGRVRSSSDCQSGRKENAITRIAETASCDGLDYFSAFTPPNSLPKYPKRRSVSTSGMDVKVFDFSVEEDIEEDADFNELEQSLDNESGVHFPKSQSEMGHDAFLSITSESSVASSKSSDNVPAERPTLLQQLSRGHSAYLHSPESPEKTMALFLTSTQDALGYATLKDIQKRRVYSLSFHDSSVSNEEVSKRHLKSHSLDANVSKAFDFSAGDFDFAESEIDAPSKYKSSSETVKEIRYIGVCLPSSPEFIFKVPKQSKNMEEIEDSVSTDLYHSESPPLEFHSEENCISNHSFSDKLSLQRIVIDEESEEQSSSSLVLPSDICTKQAPVSRSNSVKGIKLREDSYNQQLIRKEAMRLVTNLCSSVAVKASEQGLLNLKQKFPDAFQDICLYSEICYYMATYNFRLGARRFLQELFLDAAFEQLQKEAEAVINSINISQKSTKEA